MACQCNNESCEQIEISGIIYCTCTTIIENVSCPENCETIIRDDGNAECLCTETEPPIIQGSKIPVFFDNDEYFENLSWTIAYSPTNGSWVSYYTFTPDYTISLNNMFQVGYNFGQHKETLWTHLMNRSSFCVFQGEKHVPQIEYPVISENVNKILNSISLNIEGIYYQNDWDWSVNKDISFKNMYIYNRTNNTGMLGLNSQKTLSDNRNYPKTIGNTQEILFTSDQGKQKINTFFNRLVNQNNNIPQFNIDKNNIFKTINTNAVKFSGKRTLERMKGEWFMVHLEGMTDSRFNLILKSSTNEETIYD